MKLRAGALAPASDDLLSLDFLRFVASAGIVVHHSVEYFFPPERRPLLLERTMGLALFVDLFFVISGFVIAYVYANRVGTLLGIGKFMQRRVGRLVPLHLLTLLLSIVVWGGFVAIGKGGDHAPSFEPRCILQTALFLHAIVKCGNGIAFNGVSWSIGSEMVMYLLFPLFAWLVLRSRFALPALAIAALSSVIAYDLVINDGTWLNLPAVERALPSFLLGAAIFYGKPHLKRLPAPRLVLACSLVLLLAMMLDGAPHLAVLALVYIVVISAAASDAHDVASAFVRRGAALGQLTYSIYMWHGLVILVLMNAFGDKVLHAGPSLMIVIAAVSYAAIAVISYISFVAIETPARRWIDGLRPFG